MLGFFFFCPSLSGAEQGGAGAAGQAILWTTTAGAQEETPGAEVQRGEEARSCGGEAQAEAEGGESEFCWWKSKKKLLFIVRPMLSRLWTEQQQLKLVFSELRSDMSLQCAGHWRRARGPNRTSVKVQEGGSSPRTVSRDECAFLFLSPPLF